MNRSIGPQWMPVRGHALVALALASLFYVAGCSLGVMAGKAIFGDPKLPSEFRTRTGVDLTKSKKKLLVVVRTPQSLEGDLPSLSLDLIDSIARRLKLHGVNIVDPDDVAKWIDQNGGRFDHPSELAQHFDTDYIAVIDVEQFRLQDSNSPNLYHGTASGQMQVFEVQKIAGSKDAMQVFAGNFRNQYPPHGPVPGESLSASMFMKRFVDHLSDRLGSRFYDYRLGDEM
jgi:hypothetical protein